MVNPILIEAVEKLEELAERGVRKLGNDPFVYLDMVYERLILLENMGLARARNFNPSVHYTRQKISWALTDLGRKYFESLPK